MILDGSNTKADNALYRDIMNAPTIIPPVGERRVVDGHVCEVRRTGRRVIYSHKFAGCTVHRGCSVTEWNRYARHDITSERTA